MLHIIKIILQGKRISFSFPRLRNLYLILSLLLISIFLIWFQLLTKDEASLDLKNPNDLYSSFDCYEKTQTIYNLTELIHLNRKKTHPPCSDQDWVFIDNNGNFFYNHGYLNQQGIQIDYCEYSTIDWYKDDFLYHESNFVKIKDGEQIKNGEFFIVSCSSSIPSKRQYKSAFARIFHPKRPINTEKNPNLINVFMLALDSVSREDWIERLPKSTKYLTEALDSKILKRYNIVGDGTPAALIPLLTSKHEEELPNTLHSSLNSKFVDKAYPFIWKNFSEQLNYSTLFGEDWPDGGTFQYRMVGMSSPPVTHYMRPFQLALVRQNLVKPNSLNKCLNGRNLMKLNLDYALDFMNIYKNSGFFGLMMLNEYSHNTNEHLSWADDEIFKFLNEFSSSGLYKNSVLILFSDHGARFSDIRKSVKGLLRERNPFFSIYLPDKFKNLYRQEYDTFMINFNKLITPMDIHETLSDLIKLQSNSRRVIDHQKRSISLFSEIPDKRTCKSAGIDTHWCSCMKRTEIKDANKNEQMIKMGNIFINFINDDILKLKRDMCLKIELDKINRVHLMDPIVKHTFPKNSLFKRFQDFIWKINGFITEPVVEINYEEYFFQIQTKKPQEAIYEFTITKEGEIYFIKEKSISRVNKYGNQSSCIYEKYPDLRKYCYCSAS